jgi:hypothetical protein
MPGYGVGALLLGAGFGAVLALLAGALEVGLGEGAALELGAALAEAWAANAASLAAFIMRTSFTKFVIVLSGKLNAGMAPLPFLMTVAIC